MNETERTVWHAWNLLPVPRQAHRAGAFIVYPAERFGRWNDSQEPPLRGEP